MAVFVFRVDKQFRDAGKLTDELIRLGAIPKCREPLEIKEPSWRETTNFVHIRTEGSWHSIAKLSGKQVTVTRELLDAKPEDIKFDELGRPELIEHIHRYFDHAGKHLLTEETKMRAIIEHRAEDLLPPDTMPHMSFGNGVTVVEIIPRVYIAFAVFDHSKEKRRVADEVIEQIRL